jgi:hypothetical protein
MIRNDIREILQGLLRKSEAKQVKWVDTLEMSTRDVVDLDYTVFLPESSINLFRFSGEPAQLNILNAQGNVIFSVTEANDNNAALLLNQLIESARNTLLSVDTTLADLKRALSSDDVIGEPKPEI